MKNLSKIFAVILLMGITLLSGCSKVEYSAIEGSDGSVQKIFSISLDTDELINAVGMNLSQIENVKNNILLRLINYKNNNLSDFQTRLNNDAYLAQVEKETIYNNVSVEAKVDAFNSNEIIYKEKFANVESYYYFINYNPEVDEDNETTLEKSFLVNKYCQKTKTIYSLKDAEGNNVTLSFLNEMKNYIISQFGTTVYQSMKMPTLSYSYISSNDKMHTDADKVTIRSDGKKMHTWDISTDNLEREIIFYTTVPRREIWYMFALLITAIFMVVLAVVFHNKKKKEELGEKNILPKE